MRLHEVLRKVEDNLSSSYLMLKELDVVDADIERVKELIYRALSLVIEKRSGVGP